MEAKAVMHEAHADPGIVERITALYAYPSAESVDATKTLQGLQLYLMMREGVAGSMQGGGFCEWADRAPTFANLIGMLVGAAKGAGCEDQLLSYLMSLHACSAVEDDRVYMQKVIERIS